MVGRVVPGEDARALVDVYVREAVWRGKARYWNSHHRGSPDGASAWKVTLDKRVATDWTDRPGQVRCSMLTLGALKPA